MFRSSCYLVLLCCVFASACRKDKDESAVTYVNNVPQQVTLDIYPNMAAYASGSNQTIRQTINGSDKAIIPGDNFVPGLTYYVDWYTDDNMYNNWFNDKFPGGNGTVAIAPVVGSNTYYTSDYNKNYNKLVFLNGNGTQTSWIAIDAYQYSAVTGYVSVWNNMNLNERYQEITVRKDFTASYRYTDNYGAVKTQDLEFKVHNAPHSYIEFLNDAGGTLGSMAGGTLPTSTAPDYNSNAIDTVLGLMPASELRFLMVKKQP